MYKKSILFDLDTCDVIFLFNSSDENNNSAKSSKIISHKIILATGSSTFRNMFSDTINQLTEITIDESTHDGFQQFLQFFYVSDPELSIEHILEVIKLINKYNVRNYLVFCEKFLIGKVTIEMVCDIYEMAIKQELSTEFINSIETIIQENALEVFETNGFLQCDRAVLTGVLKMNTLICHDELDVLSIAIKWAENAGHLKGVGDNSIANIIKELDDCFYLIRFPTMSAEQFLETIDLYPQMFRSKQIINFLQYRLRGQSLCALEDFPTVPRIFNGIASKFFVDPMTEKRLVEKRRFEFSFSTNATIILKQISFDIDLDFISAQARLTIYQSTRPQHRRISYIIKADTPGYFRNILPDDKAEIILQIPQINIFQNTFYTILIDFVLDQSVEVFKYDANNWKCKNNETLIRLRDDTKTGLISEIGFEYFPTMSA